MEVQVSQLALLHLAFPEINIVEQHVHSLDKDGVGR